MMHTESAIFHRSRNSANALVELLSVDRASWRTELEGIAAYFNEFGNRVPVALHMELTEALLRLESIQP